MLAQEEYVEVHALRKRGWSISAIARHVGRDRKTVRAYLLEERGAGERTRVEADPFGVFEPYVRQRLADDPHVWATVLFRRSGGFGLRTELCDVCSQGTQSAASAVVWGVCGHEGPGDGGD